MKKLINYFEQKRRTNKNLKILDKFKMSIVRKKQYPDEDFEEIEKAIRIFMKQTYLRTLEEYKKVIANNPDTIALYSELGDMNEVLENSLYFNEWQNEFIEEVEDLFAEEHGLVAIYDSYNGVKIVSTNHEDYIYD